MKRKPAIDPRQLTREKLAFRYSTALERGDFDTLARVLREAETDPALERMLHEINMAYESELLLARPAPAIPLSTSNHHNHEEEGDTYMTYATTTPGAGGVSDRTPRVTFRAWTLAAALLALALLGGLIAMLRQPPPDEQPLAVVQGGSATPTPANSPTFTFTPEASPLPATVTAMPVGGSEIPSIPPGSGILCQVMALVPEGTRLYSRPDPNAVEVGAVPAGLVLNVLDQQSGPFNEQSQIVWFYVSAEVNGSLQQGWISARYVSQVGASCPPMEQTGMPFTTLEPTLAYFLTQEAGCATATWIPTVTLPLMGSAEAMAMAATTTAIFMQAQATAQPPQMTATAIVGQANPQNLQLTQFPATVPPPQVIAVTATALAEIVGQPPAVASEVAAFTGGFDPCNPVVTLPLQPTFVPTPTSFYLGTNTLSAITLEQVGDIPANTPVYITSGTFTGEWVYGIMTQDALNPVYAEAREAQISPYYAPATPVSPFVFGGYDLLTLDSLGSIPPNTRVRIVSGFYDGQEWQYEVMAKDGVTMAMARASQLTYAPGVTPGGATPTAQYFSGRPVITNQQVGDIPANTPVQIGSAWYNGVEWLYTIIAPNGVFAEARESQLSFAPQPFPMVTFTATPFATPTATPIR